MRAKDRRVRERYASNPRGMLSQKVMSEIRWDKGRAHAVLRRKGAQGFVTVFRCSCSNHCAGYVPRTGAEISPAESRALLSAHNRKRKAVSSSRQV